MKRKAKIALLGVAGFGAFVYVNNASWLVPSPSRQPTLLAHRGLHQTYRREGLHRDTCTATRIHEPTHDFLENTIPSMRAAFEHGAAIVELDIHPTIDGRFAVFHDWILDCRTDGKGVTREQSLAYLKSLDIGYGYSYDNGKTFPFRGKAMGLMPSLTEVLNTFPNERFLINIKSNDPNEGDLLTAFLQRRPAGQVAQLMVYGGEKPTARVLQLMPELKVFTKRGVKTCFFDYALVGWTGYLPKACRDTVFLIPANYAPYLWGWPRRLLARIEQAGSEVFVVGRFDNEHKDGTSGIDDTAALDQLSSDYAGGIWTNRVELLAPALEMREHRE